MNSLTETTAAFFADSCIHVSLPDGTSLSFPIAGNWRLENATPEQLNNVVVDEDGLHWPDIDEDLSFAGLLRGDHGKVDAWRRAESWNETVRRRPDLI